MNALQAIEYLYIHGVGSSEWQEAGMWHAVCRVIQDKRESKEAWTTEELDELINAAEGN